MARTKKVDNNNVEMDAQTLNEMSTRVNKNLKEKVEGGWNASSLTQATMKDNHDLCKCFMYVEIQLLADAYGMMPASKELLNDFIASKAPDALTMTEELEIITEEEVADRQTTIWPITSFRHNATNGTYEDVFYDRLFKPSADDVLIKMPFLYNYQMRGLFKDACGLLSRAKNNISADTKAYKKIIDGNIFVFPRHLAFELPETYFDDFGNEIKTYDDKGRLRICQRPLRISGPTGERTAISSSELIPAGSTMKMKIGMTSPSFRPAVEEWLNYGVMRGIGQWRNSGAGAFRWRELDENWQPICQ